MPFVAAILRRLRSELNGEVPLIGFSGAPWTLASYMIEGGGSKSFAEIKKMAFSEPTTLHALARQTGLDDHRVRSISDRSRRPGRADLRHVGRRTDAARLRNVCAARNTEHFLRKSGTSVPRILYINGCSTILESMASSGADVLSVDWRIPIAEARARVGQRVALQGNLDPCALLGSPSNLTATAERILKQAGPTGHIFNLGHGILPTTPVDNARALVDFVKVVSARAMKLGVLVFNLGGPETLRDVKPFLYRLFSDPGNHPHQMVSAAKSRCLYNRDDSDRKNPRATTRRLAAALPCDA